MTAAYVQYCVSWAPAYYYCTLNYTVVTRQVVSVVLACLFITSYMQFADLSEASRKGTGSGFQLWRLPIVKTVCLDFNGLPASVDFLHYMLWELLAVQREEGFELELALDELFERCLGAWDHLLWRYAQKRFGLKSVVIRVYNRAEAKEVTEERGGEIRRLLPKFI